MFTIAPVEVYKLVVSLQGNFTTGITGMIGSGGNISTMSAAALSGVIARLKSARVKKEELRLFHFTTALLLQPLDGISFPVATDQCKNCARLI